MTYCHKLVLGPLLGDEVDFVVHVPKALEIEVKRPVLSVLPAKKTHFVLLDLPRTPSFTAVSLRFYCSRGFAIRFDRLRKFGRRVLDASSGDCYVTVGLALQQYGFL